MERGYTCSRFQNSELGHMGKTFHHHIGVATLKGPSRSVYCIQYIDLGLGLCSLDMLGDIHQSILNSQRRSGSLVDIHTHHVRYGMR